MEVSDRAAIRLIVEVTGLDMQAAQVIMRAARVAQRLARGGESDSR